MDDDQYADVDEQILRGIDRERVRHAACTVGNLASSLHLAKSTVALRCAGLRDRGLVTWSDNYAGSLQRVQTIDQRLRELKIIDAVEVVATGNDYGPVSAWCRDVLAEAGGVVVPAEPDRTGDERPVGEDKPETTAAASPLETGWYCVPCQQPFKTKVAMDGHTRASKAHLAKVAALV